MGCADALSDSPGKVRRYLPRGCRINLRSYSRKQEVVKVLEPSESSIVLKDLAVCIEQIPRIHLNRYYHAEAGKVERDDDGCRSDILVGGKMCDCVVDGIPEERDRAGVQRQGCKETEEVLGVQLWSIEGTSDIDTAFDVLCEETGIDHLGLHCVVGIHESVQEGGLELVQLIECEVRLGGSIRRVWSYMHGQLRSKLKV